MKEFSSAWVASKKPGKQRKYRANAPLHTKRKFLCAHLTDALIDKHKKRSLRLRVGDTVKVLRGQYKGRTGKVQEIDTKKTEVIISGIDVQKADGTKSARPISPSNLMITELITEDKKRFK